MAVFAVTLYGVIIAPSTSYASRAFERAGVISLLAFSVLATTTGIGFALGSTVSGTIAELFGDGAAYTVMGCLCAVTLVPLRWHRRRALAGVMP